jgi:RNA polymerase sigma-70 factor (sigma-E family)
MTLVGGTGVDTDTELADLYHRHYRDLLRLAALLLDDPSACEDVAQEAFIRVLGRLDRIREPELTLAYLRQTVVNLSRSTLRRRLVAMRHDRSQPREHQSPEEAGHAAVQRAAIVLALQKLPRRQREAVVLRFYGDLTEAQTAEAMGVSVGSVKSSTSRGLTALGSHLEALR